MRTSTTPVTALLLLLAVAAAADVINPVEYACNGRGRGDSCRLEGRSGRCVESTCGRIDYSGGQGPKSASVPCLLCKGDEAATGSGSGTSRTAVAVAVAVLAAGVFFAYHRHRRSNGRDDRG